MTGLRPLENVQVKAGIDQMISEVEIYQIRGAVFGEGGELGKGWCSPYFS